MLTIVCPNCDQTLALTGEAERCARKDWGIDAATSGPIPAFCSVICQAMGGGALDVHLSEGSGTMTTRILVLDHDTGESIHVLAGQQTEAGARRLAMRCAEDYGYDLTRRRPVYLPVTAHGTRWAMVFVGPEERTRR